MFKILYSFFKNLNIKNTSETDLGNDPVHLLLIRLSVPAILSMLTAAVYNVADRIFVGQLNPLGLTAIGITMPVQIIQMAFVLMVGVGSATLISVELGRKNIEKAQKILDLSFYYFVITQAVVTVLGLLFIDPLFSLLQVSDAVYPYARIYTVITLIGGVPGLTGYCLNNSVRAIGHARESMIYVIVSSAVNIVLDTLFVLVFRWGVAGAAAATVLAQTLVTVFVLVFFSRHPIMPGWTVLEMTPAKILRSPIHPLQTVRDITQNGLPNLYMQVFGTAVNLLLNRSIMRYGGDTYMASMTIIQAMSSFFLMAVYGVGQGAQPIFGYNYGAEKPERIRKALGLSVRFVFLLMLAVVVVTFLFPRAFISLFTRDVSLVDTTVPYMLVCLSILPLTAVHSITATFFQSTKRPFIATVLYVLRYGGILIPALLILPPLVGIKGVYIANALSDGGSGLVAACLLLFRRRIRQENI